MRPTKLAAMGQYALRDYQKECIDSCLEAFNEGHRRVGVSLATGGGKTIIFSHLISEVKPVPGHGDKSLIVVHREELVHQAYDRIKQIQPELTMEIEMARHHASGLADVTVSSIQSIARPARLSKFDPAQYKLLIFDEAHHASANQYLKLLKHFKADKPGSEVAVAGFSATLYRGDGKSLAKVMDELVFHRDLIDMMQTGWLCNVHISTVKVDVDLAQVEDAAGDFEAGDLSRALNTDGVNSLVVKTWSHYSDKGTKYKSTLIFCVNIDHSMSLANQFRKYGIDARVVTSNTPRDERRDIVEAFRTGQFPVLVNCSVFTEGTDIPNIDMVIVNRPTKSPGLLSQMIGRGLRKHPGKDHCHVIDIVGVSGAVNVVTSPSLFRLPPQSDLGQTINVETETAELKEKQQREKHDPENPAISAVELETHNSLQSFLLAEQGFRAAGMSSLNWLPLNDRTYILSSRDTYLKLEQTKAGNYNLHRYFAIPGNYVVRYRKCDIFTGITTASAALRAADKYARDNADHFVPSMVARNAAWKEVDSTKTQRSTLARLVGKVNRPELVQDVETYKLVPNKMTKGHASDLITQFKIGGPTSVLSWMVRQEKRREQQRKVQQFAWAGDNGNKV